MEILTPGSGLIFWQVVVFLGLVLVLAKFAWKPILNSLKEREGFIQQALDSAEQAKQEMALLRLDNEKLLKEAREERDRIMREARDVANRLREDTEAEARRSADKIVADARAQINTEKKAALRDVRVQVAMLSIEVSEKLLKKNLGGSKEQKALVESYIKDLDLN
jgi:F-type H+-transporting ATPase subunit b